MKVKKPSSKKKKTLIKNIKKFNFKKLLNDSEHTLVLAVFDQKPTDINIAFLTEILEKLENGCA